MEKIIIAAVGEEGTIGKNGKLPWDIPEDLERFKELTKGNPVVMGRKTFESLPEKNKPLPDRPNIVLTASGVSENVEEASSLSSAWEKASMYSKKVFIIGGESVYEQTLDEADRMEITEVHDSFDGDTHFPKVDWDQWEEEDRDARDGFSFVTYVRK